jgi:hypothetical protein
MLRRRAPRSQGGSARAAASSWRTSGTPRAGDPPEGEGQRGTRTHRLRRPRSLTSAGARSMLRGSLLREGAPRPPADVSTGLLPGRGDDTLGSPCRARISQCELPELLFCIEIRQTVPRRTMSSRWTCSRRQYLSQQYPPIILATSTLG